MLLFGRSNYFESFIDTHDATYLSQFQISEIAILLSQYDLKFVQKAMKRQAIMDFMADHLVPSFKLYEGIPTKLLKPMLPYMTRFDRYILVVHPEWTIIGSSLQAWG